jgi:LysR family hydrogen peroxide-inducible transcriptional activator
MITWSLLEIIILLLIMNLPTLRQLQYLIAVIELKHFGHAAEKNFVTQSTLSAGIQDLENQLGVKLLERTNRKVLPTPIGIEIATQARKILSLTEDLVDSARSNKNPLEGRVRIGVIPTISPFLLPKALPLIREKMPLLELELVEDQSQRLIDQIAAAKIDIAVMALPFELHGLKYMQFADEPFLVALPKNHKLAKNDYITIEQIPEDELMLLMEGHCLREHALSACNLPLTQQNNTVQGTSLYTLIEMVASGMGITLIPQMAQHADMVSRTDVEIRPMVTSSKQAKRGLGLVWRPSYQRHETVDALSSLFTEALAEK